MSRPHLLEFPDEILLKIVSGLDPISIIVAARSCRQLNALCMDSSLCHKLGKLVMYLRMIDKDLPYYITNLGGRLWPSALTMSLYLTMTKEENVILVCRTVADIYKILDVFVRADAGRVLKAAFMIKEVVGDMLLSKCFHEIVKLPYEERYNMIVTTDSLYNSMLGSINRSSLKYTTILVSELVAARYDAENFRHLLFAAEFGFSNSLNSFVCIDYRDVDVLIQNRLMPVIPHHITPVGGLGIKKYIDSYDTLFIGFPDIESKLVSIMNNYQNVIVLYTYEVAINELNTILANYACSKQYDTIHIKDALNVIHARCYFGSLRMDNDELCQDDILRYGKIDCILCLLSKIAAYDLRTCHYFTKTIRKLSCSQNIDMYVISNPCMDYLLKPSFKQKICDILKFAGDFE